MTSVTIGGACFVPRQVWIPIRGWIENPSEQQGQLLVSLFFSANGNRLRGSLSLGNTAAGIAVSPNIGHRLRGSHIGTAFVVASKATTFAEAILAARLQMQSLIVPTSNHWVAPVRSTATMSEL